MEDYETAVNEAEAVSLASGLTVKVTLFCPGSHAVTGVWSP